MEQTFVALKPDAVQRGLIGTIISRFEQKGFKLVGLKLMQIPASLAEQHYGEHADKPFFKGLVDFITSGPVVAMVWEGQNVVATVRTMMGATNPKDSAPGTIRGDFAVDLGRNIIHGSDGVDSAKREIGLFFSSDELVSSWPRSTEGWVYEKPQQPAATV
ncbi:MAG: nucleoside-diphosphate kinase [Cyanobacteria bacterium HKST-UBA06]|nr:nucleoside-diphosphate kinase [Cyanobacteria bacterium HKST-UBA05]MCA9798786.1 nucleoside-diphosphate kinase [Cyanobacteria bacterium HKST-UBA04]MCA9808438.1 nucleoside-diphosphate kinase [Cyanobacteria bacterium HKST-UBA06]MCA9841641.1 nucleoside-diphosphate kinase [Cyanobacteria bacterium HKST-UBA03]